MLRKIPLPLLLLNAQGLAAPRAREMAVKMLNPPAGAATRQAKAAGVLAHHREAWSAGKCWRKSNPRGGFSRRAW